MPCLIPPWTDLVASDHAPGPHAGASLAGGTPYCGAKAVLSPYGQEPRETTWPETAAQTE